MADDPPRHGQRRPSGLQGQSQATPPPHAADPEADRLYTVKDLAELWHVSPLSIRRLIYAGQLDAVYIGGKMQRIPRASAMAYLARHKRASPDA